MITELQCQCGHGYSQHYQKRCRCGCDAFELARPEQIDRVDYYGLSYSEMNKVLE